MHKCLITGGAGFIGSNLAEKMVELGYDVIVLDNLNGGKLSNLKDIINRITFIKCDIRDKDSLRKLFRGIDYVIHLAAISSTAYSSAHPEETNEVNIAGTINVLAAAAENKVKRLVFASSAAVYGNAVGLPKKESSISQPVSPYGKAKLMCEHLCRLFYETFGLKSIILRFFNVYGPKASSSSPYSGVISIFISKLLSKKRPVILGDGNQTRDFVYVEDVIRAIIASLNSPNKKIINSPINIATGKSASVNKMLKLLCVLLKQNVKPLHKEHRKGDIKHSLASITKARKEIKYRPRYSLEEGLKKTLNWLMSN